MMTLTKDDLKAIEGVFAGRFETIDRRFEAIDQRFEAMDRRFEAMDQRFDNLASTVHNIDARLEHVESDVSALKVGQQQLWNKLNQVSDKVDATYDLALENWGQIEESKVRLTILES